MLHVFLLEGDEGLSEGGFKVTDLFEVVVDEVVNFFLQSLLQEVDDSFLQQTLSLHFFQEVHVSNFIVKLKIYQRDARVSPYFTPFLEGRGFRFRIKSGELI